MTFNVLLLFGVFLSFDYQGRNMVRQKDGLINYLLILITNIYSWKGINEWVNRNEWVFHSVGCDVRVYLQPEGGWQELHLKWISYVHVHFVYPLSPSGQIQLVLVGLLLSNVSTISPNLFPWVIFECPYQEAVQ